MIKFIGVDISKQTFDAYFLTDPAMKECQFKNDLGGFTEFVQRLDAHSHVVMEASGPYYLQLAFYLEQKGIALSVINPLVIRRFSQMRLMRAKTDRKDARLIAEYGQIHQPGRWKSEEATTIRLKQMHTAMEALDKQHTALKNQLESFGHMPVQDAKVIKVLEKLLKEVDKQKQALEVHLKEQVKQHYEDTYKALLSIPGIGPKAASLLIAITNNFQKFSHYKQLLSYVGMSPRIFQSGTSVKGRAHICKMGMGRVRKILYLCSWSAKRHNPACRLFYERLKAKGKPERVTKIAIANKLLKQAFAIATQNSFFDKNYQPAFGF